ncbi:MAG: hypothetical protein JSU68_12620, partial [Phycisphaerales bacterium]
MSGVLAIVQWQAQAGLLLDWLGQAVLYGTALAALTWLLLRIPALRPRPWLHGALWLIVLIKFLVPAGPDWSFSLASAVGRLTTLWPHDASSGLEAVPVVGHETSLVWMPESRPAPSSL